jgi:hypothetical protein
MTVRIGLTLSLPKGRNPFAQGFSKRRALNEFAAKLHALAGGIGGGVEERASLRVSTANASAIVTCAAVQNADTVTINGQALTATQKHARGTITPTTSGIDVADTVTINTTGILTARQHHAKGTITCAAADAADNVTIGATTFVGTAGAVTPGAATYSIDTGNNEAATSLAAQINAHAVASTIVTASASSAVVTLRAVASGIAGNSIVLTSTDGTDLAVSGSGTLAGATAVAANEFDISGTDAQTCTSLAAAINASSLLAGIVTAWASATVVTVRAVTAGTGGNSIGLASSDAQLAVSAANLAGGAAVANNVFDFGGTDTETATDLARAINATTTDIVELAVEATSSGAAVTISAEQGGVGGNDITIATSNGSRLAITGSLSRLAGGTETTYTF